MRDFTTGSITRHLLATSGFMLVTMVFQTLYVLVDLYWVGRLGTTSVAAVAISSNLMFVVLALTQMLAVGTTTLVSHAAGRRNRDRAGLVFNQAQTLALVSAIAFTGTGWLLQPWYAAALSADVATSREVEAYLRWFIPALGLQFWMVAMSAALRGTGSFRPGMVVQTGTVILNILLAPVLIFGWGTGRAMGVAGAAIATLLSIAVGTAWLACYFVPRDAYLRFDRTQWAIRPRLWGEMLKVGLPAGAEFALMAAYLFLVYHVSRPFGPAAQAGVGVGLRLVQSLFMPAVALGFAVASVGGQNFGAGNAARVRATFTAGALMAVSMMLAAVAISHMAPAAMVRVFTSDANAIAFAEEYLRIVSWNFIASGVIFVSSSMFQALGNTIPALLTSMLRVVLLAVPVLLLAGTPGFALRWVWYLSVLSVAVQMGANLVLLRREFRRRLMFAPAPAHRAASS